MGEEAGDLDAVGCNAGPACRRGRRDLDAEAARIIPEVKAHIPHQEAHGAGHLLCMPCLALAERRTVRRGLIRGARKRTTAH